MVITLIGYRGTGKSAVASALAARLHWTSVDADNQIEALAGQPIRRIFADEGEPAFRELEQKVMARLLTRSDRLVIAAGGGAILNEHTRHAMQAAGPVVWLTASVDTILARVQQDTTTAERRPNLTPEGGRREVEEVLSHREPLYREVADIIVDTDDLSVDQVAEQIATAVEPELREGAAG